jgi:hypothetical protein
MPYRYDRPKGVLFPGGPHGVATPLFDIGWGTPADILKSTTDHNFFEIGNTYNKKSSDTSSTTNNQTK